MNFDFVMEDKIYKELTNGDVGWLKEFNKARVFTVSKRCNIKLKSMNDLVKQRMKNSSTSGSTSPDFAAGSRSAGFFWRWLGR